MRVRRLLGLLIGIAAFNVSAQLIDIDPDWKEVEVPAPPAFKPDRLIYLEMPSYVSVKVGVDPETLRITSDGIVRYVVVATSSSGGVNASYEGIRCVTAEVKVYARQSAAGKWNALPDPQWKPLVGNQPSMHALALARQGACEGRAAASYSPADIVRKLKTPPSSYR